MAQKITITWTVFYDGPRYCIKCEPELVKPEGRRKNDFEHYSVGQALADLARSLGEISYTGDLEFLLDMSGNSDQSIDRKAFVEEMERNAKAIFDLYSRANKATVRYVSIIDVLSF